ncbi:hypothetical protein LIA77_03212 [Sarocladium implicatum]|nr:hypothetical protein LIA77_03212 [Sarocladium implicatum]
MSILRICTQALAAGLMLSATALAQTSGTFSVMTINVAGLPAILNNNDVPGDKKTNSGLIGAALAREAVDIVNLQEDFAYHAYIYATDTHPYRTPTSGTVPVGDGLNTLLNWDYQELRRTKWNKCSLNSGDCLTPKGFSFIRLKIDGGNELHVYNLHGDAGSNNDDVASRSAGIDQLLAAINANDNGSPIIVAGDTNDRYTNSGVSITKLLSAGFKDPWVDIIKGGKVPVAGSTADACGNPADDNTCEIVDKILYRSGKSVALSATSFNYVPEDFRQPDGNILTDHNPVLVDIKWSKV